MTKKFTETHEWILTDGKVGTVGVTAYAQKELGDIVYVELPVVGTHVNAGDEAVVLESTKAAADVYTPVAGTIIAVNEQLNDAADLVNSSSEEKGWLFKIEIDDEAAINALLSKEEYEARFQ